MDIITKIRMEVKRAKDLHPNWPKDLLHQMAIVGEEHGEATRAAVQFVYEKGDISEVETELIQTCATCIRMLEFIEENNNQLEMFNND